MKPSRFVIFLIGWMLVLAASTLWISTAQASQTQLIFAITLTPSQEAPIDTPVPEDPTETPFVATATPLPAEPTATPFEATATPAPADPTATPFGATTTPVTGDPTATQPAPTRTPVVSETPQHPDPTQTPEPVSSGDPAPAPVSLPRAGIGEPQIIIDAERNNQGNTVDLFQYSSLGSQAQLIIPGMDLTAAIQPVQTSNGSWDIRFLGESVAWLAETSFPGAEGNSVLTAHVSDRSGQPPFRWLITLKKGSLIWVNTEESISVYKVREKKVVEPNDLSVLQSSDVSQLTLLTCTNWDAAQRKYHNRLVVIADRISTFSRIQKVGALPR